MSKIILQNIITVRSQLKGASYKNGEIKGSIIVRDSVLSVLQQLANANIIESQVLKGDKSVALDKVTLDVNEEFEIFLTLYTKQITGATYFEDIDDLIKSSPASFPSGLFYVHALSYFSDEIIFPEKIKYLKDVIDFIELLRSNADYISKEIGEPECLIFFEKQKLNLPVIYNSNAIQAVPFLTELTEQLNNAHDKKERRAIFISELIANLQEMSENERFSNLLLNITIIYENYLKSHLLYLEKFSYHDLKMQVDNDKLEYTKKIYGSVNEIQTKIIAVPAAYLIVLSQFDFTGVSSNKNIFIFIGCFLFSILLEVLLRNQFGLIGYIQNEILCIQNRLLSKAASLDLNEFVVSFDDLSPVIKKQKCYLWIFRIITWSVPVTALAMYFLFKP